MTKQIPLRRGFTLIEMLVVVSILGILLTVTGTNHSRVLERSRDAALMVDIRHIRNAIHQYALDRAGLLPVTLDELAPKYLSRKPEIWRGSKAKGTFKYEPQTGQVSLFNEAGSGPEFARDTQGRRYEQY
jgi:general secretion pathway protein G